MHGVQCTAIAMHKPGTHRELGVAVAMAGGLLSLVGVVVEGGAEEAGLYLGALPPHQVRTAGTSPILHGAPGGDHPVPRSVLLSVSVLTHSSIHPCPHPSISEDGDPSLHPKTPLSPQSCPQPSTDVPNPPSPHTSPPALSPLLPPRPHALLIAVGSPEVTGAGPAAPHIVAQAPELGLQRELGGVGHVCCQPSPGGCCGAGVSQSQGAWCGAGCGAGRGTHHALAAGAPGHEALAVAVPTDGVAGGAAGHRAPWVTPAC